MTRPSLKRAAIVAGIVILFAGAASFLPLPFLRPGIEQALARRLGRRVEIGEVSLSLLGGPGFSLSGVTIHEDPRAGIEPIAYAQTVDARIDLLGLLAGRRGFSSLRLGDATLNLVRTRAGEWNFQYLLNARLSDVPAIHLRGARVNLKFGQAKSVLYFDDADLDMSPGDQGSVDLRFSGAPARTDRPAQYFGHVFVRAAWIPSSADRPLNVKVELEPSSLDGFAKLFGPGWFDLQGQVSLNAQLAGPPSQLTVAGELQLDEGRRSDFLPSRDGKWSIPYRGTLNLADEKIELEYASSANAPDAIAPDAAAPPVAARLEASDLLTSPQWRASVEISAAPLGPVADAARQLGAPLPAKLSADGKVSGHLQYEADSGLTGNLEATDAVLTLPDSPPVQSASVPITIGAQSIAFGPSAVSLSGKPSGDSAGDDAREKPGDGQSAQVQASYTFDGSGTTDLKITTRGLALDGLRSFAPAPLVGQAAADPAVRNQSVRNQAVPDRLPKALWRGSLRYQRSGADEGVWTGDYSVENARISVEGIADPIRIQSANISAGPGRLAVTKIRAKAGDIAFTGEYRVDSPAGDTKVNLAHQFKLQVGEAAAAELDRLFKPTLVRGGGFIERTLRLGGPSPAPEWLARRKVEGTMSIAALNAGDHRLAVNSARVMWDGVTLRVAAVDARLLDPNVEGAALRGDLNIDLSEGAPQYRFTGKAGGVPYKGGRLDFEGRLEAAGDGLPLLASLRASGTLNGTSIAFSPDADFRNVSGGFEASLQGTSLHWKFMDLEVTLGSDIYLGEGTTAPDGKVVLDLINRGRQVRYTGSLLTLAGQP